MRFPAEEAPVKRALLVVLLLLIPAAPVAAAERKLERLDRGLVAATTGTGVFLSWRLLGPEATGHSPPG